MKQRLWLSFFSLFFCTTLVAEPIDEPCANNSYQESLCPPPFNLSAMGDRHFHMRSGALNLHSAYHAYNWADDFLYSFAPFCQEGWIGFGLRTAKWLALDFPITNLVLVTQHEVFGHGARGREFKLSPNYHIDIPFPYGEGGGLTQVSSTSLNNRRPLEKTAFITGGVEATELLGRRIALESLCHECLDAREAWLYTVTFHDQTFYVESLADDIFDRQGHDIQAYIQEVNTYCGQEALSRKKLRRLAWINLLDAMSLVSWSTWYDYLWSGNLYCELPSFTIGCVQLLPGARLTLAPYGPEVGGHSYFKLNDMPGFIYARYGDNCGVHSYGFGIEMDSVFTNGDWIFGFKWDLWKQPFILTESFDTNSQWGTLILAKASYCWTNRVSFLLELGGKTAGFVPGEELNRGIVARVGIQLYDLSST